MLAQKYAVMVKSLVFCLLIVMMGTQYLEMVVVTDVPVKLAGFEAVAQVPLLTCVQKYEETANVITQILAIVMMETLLMGMVEIITEQKKSDGLELEELPTLLIVVYLFEETVF